MKILILGVNGFIGNALTRRILTTRDWEVYGMDLYSNKLEESLDHPRFNFLEGDIAINKEWIEYHIRKCDLVLPLVAIATPMTYVKQPLRVFELDFEENLRVVRQCVKYGTRIIFPSTSEVYGSPEVHPQPESYWGHVNPIGLRSCYDEGKRVAETLTMDYHRQNKVDIKIIRIFNTYGPRMALNDGRVVSNLVIQALREEPLTIYGEGLQTRSFCYVSDLIEGFIAIMHSENILGPLNLGNPEEHTILELAEIILKLTQSSSTIEHKPLPSDDPIRRCPDISSVKEKIGWTPKIELEQGLQKTIDYFQEKLNLNNS